MPGSASAGLIEDEARANFEEAIRLYFSSTEISLA